MYLENHHYKLMIEQREWEGGPTVYNADEKRQLRQLKKEFLDRMAVSKNERKRMEESMMDIRKGIAILMKSLNDMSKKRGKMARLRQELERTMSKFGIDRPVYHGGALEGGKIKIKSKNTGSRK